MPSNRFLKARWKFPTAIPYHRLMMEQIKEQYFRTGLTCILKRFGILRPSYFADFRNLNECEFKKFEAAGAF